jgi:hypothetical protein
MKTCFFIINCLLSSFILADIAKFSVVVLSKDDLMPIKGVQLQANFWEDNGWKAWTESPHVDVDRQITDKNGFCRFKGKTNCGNVCCFVTVPPHGFYSGKGWGTDFKKKNIFGVWQPDNLVVTLRLDKVENPIPLFVKQIFSRASDSVSSNYFDIGKGKMEFDMVKGSFLPPIGKGEYADICFTRLDREDLGIGTNFNGRTALAYRDCMVVKFLGEGNGLIEIPSKKTAGIKIRTAPLGGYKTDYLVTKGKDKSVKRFSSSNPDRNFAFRIRTKSDKNGKVVSAYYGKIYGDIEIKKPYTVEVSVAAPSFLYYLNPTSLDRNLEWDMKNNLCPEPGVINSPRAP